MAKKKTAAKSVTESSTTTDDTGAEVSASGKATKKKKAVKKKATSKEAKGFEESLWDSANRQRGSVESSEYKHVVLSLIFLKFVSDKFEEYQNQTAATVAGKSD